MELLSYSTGKQAGSPVTILTQPEGALLDYPRGEWTGNFAVNRTMRGMPVRIPNGWWMRGFEDFERKDRLYLIDAERKLLGVGPMDAFILMDGDKIDHSQHHLYKGTVDELVAAFLDDGYRLIERDGYYRP